MIMWCILKIYSWLLFQNYDCFFSRSYSIVLKLYLQFVLVKPFQNIPVNFHPQFVLVFCHCVTVGILFKHYLQLTFTSPLEIYSWPFCQNFECFFLTKLQYSYQTSFTVCFREAYPGCIRELSPKISIVFSDCITLDNLFKLHLQFELLKHTRDELFSQTFNYLLLSS